MVKVLRALWLIARQSFLSTVIELGAAAAIVYGVYLQWGAPVAWIVGGLVGILFAFEIDLNRPEQGPGTER